MELELVKSSAVLVYDNRVRRFMLHGVGEGKEWIKMALGVYVCVDRSRSRLIE